MMPATKPGRPAGEVHLALLQAAAALRLEFAESGRGATLQEIVHRSQVGYAVARRLVADLKRHGHLCKVGERRVAYRNRPVYEYAPVDTVAQAGERLIPFPLAAFFYTTPGMRR